MIAPSTPILVVDDEPVLCDLLARLLRHLGYAQVETCGLPLEALQRVSARPPGLVFLDHRLPAMTGLEVLRHVRRVQPQLPCLIMSGLVTPEFRQACLQAGACAVLEKPFGLVALTELLARLPAA